MFITLLALTTAANAGYYASWHGSLEAGEDYPKETTGTAVNRHAPCGSSDLAGAIAEVAWYEYMMTLSGYSSWYLDTDEDSWAEGWNDPTGWTDVADFGYLSTIGSSGTAVTCQSTNSHPTPTARTVTGTSVRWGWGDAEVVAISASNTLDAPGRDAFGAGSRAVGIHAILGFGTALPDLAGPGILYGYYLYSGMTVPNAWYGGAQGTIGSGSSAAGVLFVDSAGSIPGWADTAANRNERSDPHSGGYLTFAWTT
jgi:hypothetical protein